MDTSKLSIFGRRNPCLLVPSTTLSWGCLHSNSKRDERGKMYKGIIIFSAFLLTLSSSALAEESDIQIFDQEHKRQFTIKQRGNQFDIFDKSGNRKGFIRDDKIYNKRWEREGFIKKGGEIEHRPRSRY